MLLYLLRLKPCFSFSFGIRQRISVEKVESKASENSIVGAQFSFKTPPGLVSYLVTWTSRAFPNFELLGTSSIERTDDQLLLLWMQMQLGFLNLFSTMRIHISWIGGAGLQLHSTRIFGRLYRQIRDACDEEVATFLNWIMLQMTSHMIWRSLKHSYNTLRKEFRLVFEKLDSNNERLSDDEKSMM